MTTRPPRDAPTDEHRPPTGTRRDRGTPALLAAFPVNIAVPLPSPGVYVGRAWLAAAGLNDTKVSSNHLRLTRAGGRLQIEDVGSRNGTWLDGHRLPADEPVPIEDGSILRVGETLLVYREAYAGPAEPEPAVGGLTGPWGLRAARAELDRLATRPVRNVLITGESGTGKEMLAEAVVRALRRSNGPFTRVNVAGITASVFEGQLFGWERGAFSGSGASNPGLLRASAGGAVLLDEIGELPVELQPKLLRVLENQEVLAVGAKEPAHVDIAVIAATNRPLEEAVQQGRFRLDLLARFPVRISLPPLRERPEDVFAILRALWERAYGPLQLGRVRVDVEAVELMMLHDWPANVRGVDQLVAAADPAVGLKLSIVEQVLGVRASTAAPPPTTREAIQEALDACGGNQSQAAKRLGLSRAQLLRRLKAIQYEAGERPARKR
ncbi:Sigma-54 dependent transcriptional regulator [Sorangium cellulosum So ce56]|uniref:Sigma-54 dependent transcriptional regulator n=1 Tax=Sorangium cellulosum (strain So ce56) TaxID=448385 RepID=A9FER7_SORC5|nr:sigma-54-dependent Fis family transcriptional regulator [Sorangium cellulosum]CAN94914.1 Sigma-54 dependent transcriptional regulator [Sorangium cellulosum So ce56]